MQIGDRIFITGGRYEGKRAEVLNVLDNDKVIVRVGAIDVAIKKADYEKVGK